MNNFSRCASLTDDNTVWVICVGSLAECSSQEVIGFAVRYQMCNSCSFPTLHWQHRRNTRECRDPPLPLPPVPLSLSSSYSLGEVFSSPSLSSFLVFRTKPCKKGPRNGGYMLTPALWSGHHRMHPHNHHPGGNHGQLFRPCYASWVWHNR